MDNPRWNRKYRLPSTTNSNYPIKRSSPPKCGVVFRSNSNFHSPSNFSDPSRRCVSSYVFVRGRTNAAARKGGSRSTSSSLCGAARRGVVDCLSRFMFTRHDPADPDNMLPRSGCIKGRKGETGEATVRRVEWEKRQRGEPEQTWRDTLFPVKETQDYAGSFYKRGDAFVMRLFLFLSFSNCRRLLIIKIRIFIVLFFFSWKNKFRWYIFISKFLLIFVIYLNKINLVSNQKRNHFTSSVIIEKNRFFRIKENHYLRDVKCWRMFEEAWRVARANVL